MFQREGRIQGVKGLTEMSSSVSAVRELSSPSVQAPSRPAPPPGSDDNSFHDKSSDDNLVRCERPYGHVFSRLLLIARCWSVPV
jgi:hypothetical protein